LIAEIAARRTKNLRPEKKHPCTTEIRLLVWMTPLGESLILLPHKNDPVKEIKYTNHRTCTGIGRTGDKGPQTTLTAAPARLAEQKNDCLVTN
jgi:hypothetical protein